MDNPDEIGLLDRLCKDDPEAFESLFQQYHTRIYAFSLRLMGSASDAEDIVQNVFLAVWGQRKSLQVKISISSYLFGVARHMVYEAIRRKLQKDVLEEYYLKQNQEYAFVTEEDVLGNELREKLQNLLKEMPQRRREIFLMNRQDGYSYLEIAQKLGISENTVDTQIRHALNFLRKKLFEYS